MDNDKNSMSTSISEIYDKLVVSLSGELTDEDVLNITHGVLKTAYEKNCKGAIFNFMAVQELDSFSYYAFEKNAKALMLMGVKVVWIGLRPGLIIGFMDLNIELDTLMINTALNLEQGLRLLDEND